MNLIFSTPKTLLLSNIPYFRICVLARGSFGKVVFASKGTQRHERDARASGGFFG